MIKLGDPTGNGIIYITQTLHGEGSKLPNMQCAIDIRMYANEYFHSPCDGVVKMVSSGLGGYVAITPFGFNGYILLVHTDRFQVRAGQRVTKGQILGQIANLGANSHLHFGMKWNDAHLPAPNPMEYFDRNLKFRPTAQDIAKEWFKGDMNGDIDRNLFRDLSLDGNEMSNKLKRGDKIVFTSKQNKRGGAGTGFSDLGAYNVGDIAIIKDGPRTSQNAQFYGKGSKEKVNDKYTWFDTTDLTNGGSCWVADIGHFRLYDPVIDNPKPTPQPQEEVSTSPQNEDLTKKIEELAGKTRELTVANMNLKNEKVLLEEKINDREKEIETYKSVVKDFETKSNQLSLYVEELERQLDGSELGQLRQELRELDGKYTTEVITRKTAQNREMEAIRQLNELKNSKFMWIVIFLEKLFSKK